MGGLEFLGLLVFLASIASRSWSVEGAKATLRSDVEALIAFRDSSIESDPKGVLGDWDLGSASNVCSWKGVICSQQGERVVGLDLSWYGLVGRLQIEHFMAVENLMNLTLRGNSFYGNLSHSSSRELLLSHAALRLLISPTTTSPTRLREDFSSPANASFHSTSPIL